MERLVANSKWNELVSRYHPAEIAQKCDFKKSLIIAYSLLYNDAWNEELQEYAVNLIYNVREIYPDEWESNWRYDAFLGSACDITLKYDERYEAYKRAYERASEPPPRLVIEFAHCCDCPGVPPITYDRAIELLRGVINNFPYLDAIALMSAVYALKGDDEKKCIGNINIRSWGKKGSYHRKSNWILSAFLRDN